MIMNQACICVNHCFTKPDETFPKCSDSSLKKMVCFSDGVSGQRSAALSLFVFAASRSLDGVQQLNFVLVL